jgi:hypothetical protein
MDKPISVGDLVVVVRWPCCGAYEGMFRTVAHFFTLHNPHCEACGAKPGDQAMAALSPVGSAPIAWLKRIPPLEELEGEKRDEKIKEPA